MSLVFYHAGARIFHVQEPIKLQTNLKKSKSRPFSLVSSLFAVAKEKEGGPIHGSLLMQQAAQNAVIGVQLSNMA